MPPCAIERSHNFESTYIIHNHHFTFDQELHNEKVDILNWIHREIQTKVKVVNGSFYFCVTTIHLNGSSPPLQNTAENCIL